LINLKSKVLVDSQQIIDDKRQKQIDFIQANEVLKRQKHIKDHSDLVDKKNYRLNYFPFTHGDAILHQRRAWKEMQ
jgi:methionine salvage enolase-phosphatase E1